MGFALSKDLPDFAKWGGGFLALIGALISGITTFFNFGKQFEGHRGIGNKSLMLAGKCETTIARCRDVGMAYSTLVALMLYFKNSKNDVQK